MIDILKIIGQDISDIAREGTKLEYSNFKFEVDAEVEGEIDVCYKFCTSEGIGMGFITYNVKNPEKKRYLPFSKL